MFLIVVFAEEHTELVMMVKGVIKAAQLHLVQGKIFLLKKQI